MADTRTEGKGESMSNDGQKESATYAIIRAIGLCVRDTGREPAVVLVAPDVLRRVTDEAMAICDRFMVADATEHLTIYGIQLRECHAMAPGAVVAFLTDPMVRA